MSGQEGMFDFIETLVFGTWRVYCVYLFFDIFLEQKKKGIFKLLLFLVIMGVSQAYLLEYIELLFPLKSSMRTYLALAVNFAVSGILLALYIGSIKRKLFLLLCYPVVVAVCENIALLLHMIIRKQSFAFIIADPTTYAQLIRTSFAVIFTAIILMRHFVRSRALAAKIRRIYSTQLIVPLLSCITFGLIIQFVNDTIILYITGFLLVINITIIMVYGKLSEYYEQNQEYALRQQHDSFREEHYRELEAHQAEIRAMKHDLKNQLIAMDAYVKTGSTERAGEQLGSLIEKLSDSDKLTFTEHTGVNGLLSATYRQAEKDGILCDFKADLPKEIGMADADLVAILGNILDNALEACRLCDGKPYIRLELAERKNALLLRCENSTDGKVSSFKTRKEDSGHHGIGMKSIQQAIQKYHGEMQYQFAAQHFILELTLFLSAPE